MRLRIRHASGKETSIDLTEFLSGRSSDFLPLFLKPHRAAPTPMEDAPKARKRARKTHFLVALHDAEQAPTEEEIARRYVRMPPLEVAAMFSRLSTVAAPAELWFPGPQQELDDHTSKKAITLFKRYVKAMGEAGSQTTVPWGPTCVRPFDARFLDGGKEAGLEVARRAAGAEPQPHRLLTEAHPWQLPEVVHRALQDWASEHVHTRVELVCDASTGHVGNPYVHPISPTSGREPWRGWRAMRNDGVAWDDLALTFSYELAQNISSAAICDPSLDAPWRVRRWLADMCASGFEDSCGSGRAWVERTAYGHAWLQRKHDPSQRRVSVFHPPAFDVPELARAHWPSMEDRDRWEAESMPLAWAKYWRRNAALPMLIWENATLDFLTNAEYAEYTNFESAEEIVATLHGRRWPLWLAIKLGIEKQVFLRVCSDEFAEEASREAMRFVSREAIARLGYTLHGAASPV
jgi:hypothetical protein